MKKNPGAALCAVTRFTIRASKNGISPATTRGAPCVEIIFILRVCVNIRKNGFPNAENNFL